MAIRYFLGWEQDELERELRRCQVELAAGNTVMSVSSGDTRTDAKVEVNIMRRIELILEELHRLDPVAYPLEDIVIITRTTPQYQ